MSEIGSPDWQSPGSTHRNRRTQPDRNSTDEELRLLSHSHSQSSTHLPPRGKRTSCLFGSLGYSLVAFSAAIGGLLFGYEIGVVGQVLGMPSFQLYFGMVVDSPDASDASFPFDRTPNFVKMNQLTTFVFLAGCAVGAAFSTVICDRFGRKKPIALGGVFFLIGAFFQTVAGRESGFFIGRFLSGLAIGVMSMCVPLFISETAPAEIRGRMTTIYQLMITIGIVLASVVNAVIIQLVQEQDFRDNRAWRLAVGMQALPAAVLVVFCLFIPESPRWLADKDRNEEALATIARLRSSTAADPAVVGEYRDIVDGVMLERTVGSGGWDEVF
ncbi:hypothetical protein HDU91_001924, partial [Kappamyces sp. JEL0680]